MLSPDPDAALARVRDLALALPAAIEKVSHGSPGFHVEKGKFFAYFWHDHHGDGETAVMVRTTGWPALHSMPTDTSFSTEEKPGM